MSDRIDNIHKIMDKRKEKVQNIYDHMVFVCKCGGVNFQLIRSGDIECSKCHAFINRRHVEKDDE